MTRCTSPTRRAAGRAAPEPARCRAGAALVAPGATRGGQGTRSGRCCCPWFSWPSRSPAVSPCTCRASGADGSDKRSAQYAGRRPGRSGRGGGSGAPQARPGCAPGQPGRVPRRRRPGQQEPGRPAAHPVRRTCASSASPGSPTSSWPAVRRRRHAEVRPVDVPGRDRDDVPDPRASTPYPVRAMLGYTFTERPNGGWMLVSDTDLDKRLPRGSHQEAWDTGEVLVKRAPRVLVVVEKGQDQLANSLLGEGEQRGEGGQQELAGRLDRLGRGDRARRQGRPRRRLHRAEERRGRDRDGDLGLPHVARRGHREGQRADSYVVINPRNRAKVDARTLAHEFTHVATAPYGAYAPRWLVEGAATYVEFLPMDGADEPGAGQVPAGGPDEVPGEGEVPARRRGLLPALRQLVPVVLAGRRLPLRRGTAGPRSARSTRRWRRSARPRPSGTGSCSNTSASPKQPSSRPSKAAAGL